MSENNATTVAQNTFDTMGTLGDLLTAIGEAGKPLTGNLGRATDTIGEMGEALSQGKDLGTILIPDDLGRDIAGIMGGAIGGVIGAGLGGIAGGIGGAVLGGMIDGGMPPGAIVGFLIGGAFGTAAGGYYGSEYGEIYGEELYDYLMGLPPSDNLTDAQRAELAAMLTAGGMPWDYNPNGEEANPSDFLGDLGKELGKLLDMLPDDLVPDFIDRLLGSLQTTLPGGLFTWLFDLIPEDMNFDVNRFWELVQNWQPYMSPLVLDLDGDGVETVGITSDKQVLFDHDGDGVRNGTGWVKSDDGLLVLDRNGNGAIDDGGELFGVYTKVNGVNAQNGFEALKAEDTNEDGIFDSNDTNFANVRVWRDIVEAA